jgi:hypothetical protein
LSERDRERRVPREVRRSELKMENGDVLGPISDKYHARSQRVPRLRRMPILACVVGSLLLVTSSSTAGADPDSIYQCIPSGFTVGIAPIKAPLNIQDEYELSGSVSFGSMQQTLAEQLYESSLFSDVIAFTDGTHPDSTDLSLLLTIPRMEEYSTAAPYSYEFDMEVMLVENAGGTVLFSKDYTAEYRPQQTATTALPASARFNADMQIAFTQAVSQIIPDLDATLNNDSDPVFSELKRAKTVIHSHLEPLWVLPVIVEGDSPGLKNYARFVGATLTERLARKNCFDFQTAPEHLSDCLAAGRLVSSEIVASLKKCLGAAEYDNGLMLITILSSEGLENRVHSVLLHLSTFEKLYDRSIVTSAGWHLGNALEKHAAGIAQASHAIPH